MKNKKGFTLVELMAVVIILLALMLIAMTITSRVVEHGKMNAFISDANLIAKSAGNRFFDEKTMDKTKREDLYNGTNPYKVCYSLTDSIIGKYVNVSGGNKYSGSVEVCHGDNCDYQYKLWITDGNKFFIDGKTKFDSSDDIEHSKSTEYFNSCGYETIGSKFGSSTVADFIYTGKEDKITILKDGIYALEAWGAQGGDRTDVIPGGYGAYSYAEVELHNGEILYINVGQKGLPSCPSVDNCKNAYNGGARGGRYIAGGGGATSIATKSGELRNLLLYHVLVVAGGGGGGGQGTWRDATSGVLSGSGYCSHQIVEGRARCGRWGYYGGYSKGNDNSHRGSGAGYSSTSDGWNGYTDQRDAYGGTGYVFNPRDMNGLMSCYKCNLAGYDFSASRTVQNFVFSEKPVSNQSKVGNGYARLTYLDQYSISYTLNGGTVATPNKTTYSKTSDSFTLINPTKVNYDFVGWTGSNGSTPQVTLTIPTGTTGNKKYVANFTPTIYTITYNLDGGELPEGVSNPSTYHVESSAITLKAPYKEGYRFIGWSLNGDSNLVMSPTIPTGSSGNRVYTAHFEKLYAATFNYNMGSYTLPSALSFISTGFTPDWSKDFKIEFNANIPSGGLRYLLLGNYNSTNYANLEITVGNALRVTQDADRGTVSGSITPGEDVNYVFTYRAMDKMFNFIAVGDTTNASVTGNLVKNGLSSNPLRIGHDYRSEETFGVFTLNDLKITKYYSSGETMTDIISAPTKDGATFTGWYDSATGGNEVNSTSSFGNTNTTYYAHWE